jgi:hypothetical protein
MADLCHKSGQSTLNLYQRIRRLDHYETRQMDRFATLLKSQSKEMELGR